MRGSQERHRGRVPRQQRVRAGHCPGPPGRLACRAQTPAWLLMSQSTPPLRVSARRAYRNFVPRTTRHARPVRHVRPPSPLTLGGPIRPGAQRLPQIQVRVANRRLIGLSPMTPGSRRKLRRARMATYPAGGVGSSRRRLLHPCPRPELRRRYLPHLPHLPHPPHLRRRRPPSRTWPSRSRRGASVPPRSAQCCRVMAHRCEVRGTKTPTAHTLRRIKRGLRTTFCVSTARSSSAVRM